MTEPPLKSYIFTVLAAFLGWTMDAFDFYAVSLTLTDVSKSFQVSDEIIASSLTASLAFRPIGAIIFGLMADKYGRRIPLMIDIFLYSMFSLASGFAQNYVQFMVIRSFFGIALGGEWGLGAALLMESVPKSKRGLFSGILQQGYAFGCLLATLVYYAVVPSYGWRAIYFIGASPSILVLLLRFFVKEKRPPVGQQQTNLGFWRIMLDTFKCNIKLTLYCILMMTAFNSLSHGSQDLFPSFLEKEKFLDKGDRVLTVVISQIGALIGGIASGIWSQKFGRRKSIVLCCVIVLAFIYPWSYGDNLAILRFGAFFLQAGVQGAWGVVPVHLNELSPSNVRGTFPGLVYNLGNFISSPVAMLMALTASKLRGEDSDPPRYALTQSIFIAFIALVLVVVTIFGPEKKDAEFENILDTESDSLVASRDSDEEMSNNK